MSRHGRRKRADKERERERDIYIYMAKASFSAYVLGKNLLKTGENVYFWAKKSTTNFGRPFVPSLFPFLPQKG